jgi:hypothetical protein
MRRFATELLIDATEGSAKVRGKAHLNLETFGN